MVLWPARPDESVRTGSTCHSDGETNHQTTQKKIDLNIKTESWKFV